MGRFEKVPKVDTNQEDTHDKVDEEFYEGRNDRIHAINNLRVEEKEFLEWFQFLVGACEAKQLESLEIQKQYFLQNVWANHHGPCICKGVEQ